MRVEGVPLPHGEGGPRTRASGDLPGEDGGHVVGARRLVLVADAPFTYVADGEPYDAYDEIEVRRGPPVLLARAGP